MFKKIRYAALGIVLLLLFACAKEEVNKNLNVSRQTCMEYMTANPEFSCFCAALNRIDLAKDTAYLKKGPFSFFVPTDAAFIRAGMNAQVISTFDKAALKKIIDGHILAGRLGSTTIAGFYKLNALCLDTTFKPILSRNYYGLFLNGNGAAESTDLGDGVVHKMDNVVFPGTATLWETIKTNKDLTLLTAAIERSEQLSVNDPSVLNYKKIVESGLPEGAWMNTTALCPTDAAFQVLGYKNVADIQQMSVSNLKVLLFMHLIRGYFFTPDYFMNGMLIPGSAVLKTGRNIIFPKIVQANIKASNGVAHLIDQVILQ